MSGQIDGSLRTVARLLDLSIVTVYRMVRSGELPSHRWGRTLRIPLVELEKLRREKLAQGYRAYRKPDPGGKGGRV